MDWPALIVLATFLAISLGLSALLVLQHWELRRMVRSRLNFYSRKKNWDLPPASLIVPVKGSDVGLEENLAALFEQDYPEYEVVFVVEDRSDPAAAVIANLRKRWPDVPSRLVVSGRAERVGQKVHNLLRTVEQLPEQTRVLAFVDADARPRPGWLRTLVDRTKYQGVGASTGYRWFVPEQQTLANLILYSANSSVTGLFGRHRRQNIIWGGSWSVRRDVFESSGIARAWDGTLTEDVVATRVVRNAGWRVEFEPGCLCASPIDFNWREALAFMRRQFFLVRVYSPLVWILGLAYATFVTWGFWGSLAVAAAWAGTGGPVWWLAVGGAVTLYGLGLARAWLRQDMAFRCLESLPRKLRVASWFDILAAPLAALVAWSVMVSAGFGRSTTWRSIRYTLDAQGQVVRLQRLDETPSPLVVPQPAETRRAA